VSFALIGDESFDVTKFGQQACWKQKMQACCCTATKGINSSNLAPRCPLQDLHAGFCKMMAVGRVNGDVSAMIGYFNKNVTFCDIFN
jgi:hypothetical protein